MADVEFPLAGLSVWVCGHKGMVGSALMRRLARENCRLIAVDRAQVDLRDQAKVHDFVRDLTPDVVLLAAAKVGGILANDSFPADFLYENLAIEANVIHASFEAGVRKLVFLGSSCIYPRLATQPIREDSLLTGPLEPTNEWYAIAKIAGVKLCQAYRKQHAADFISAMPTNLYGPGDNYDLNSSHVLPALIRKAHEAKTSGSPALTIWGTGSPLREFLHVDDCADAIVTLAIGYNGYDPINVGSGEEISIYDLALLVAEVVGYDGAIVRDPTKPDGTPRKLMDSGRLRALGWRPKISLKDGISGVYQELLSTGTLRA